MSPRSLTIGEHRRDATAGVVREVLIVLFREVARFQRQREGSFRARLRQVTVNAVLLAKTRVLTRLREEAGDLLE
jgi:hypothetical protein